MPTTATRPLAGHFRDLATIYSLATEAHRALAEDPRLTSDERSEHRKMAWEAADAKLRWDVRELASAVVDSAASTAC